MILMLMRLCRSSVEQQLDSKHRQESDPFVCICAVSVQVVFSIKSATITHTLFLSFALRRDGPTYSSGSGDLSGLHVKIHGTNLDICMLFWNRSYCSWMASISG